MDHEVEQCRPADVRPRLPAWGPGWCGPSSGNDDGDLLRLTTAKPPAILQVAIHAILPSTSTTIPLSLISLTGLVSAHRVDRHSQELISRTSSPP